MRGPERLSGSRLNAVSPLRRFAACAASIRRTPSRYAVLCNGPISACRALSSMITGVVCR